MAEINNLKAKLAQMEEAMKAQALEVKSELALSQVKFQLDLKGQLDDFLTTFLKMNTSTPPPTAPVLDSTASHVGQNTEFQILLSEKTPPSQLYTSSATP
jgi:hypothetical protein